MRRFPTLIAAILTLALIAAACGDDGGDSASADDTPTTSASAPTTTEPVETSTTTEPPATTTTEAEPAPADPAEEFVRFGGDVGAPNTEEMSAFLNDPDDDGGPFYMVNMIRYREQAEYPDGRETDLTGQEADAIYGEFMGETMLPRYGHQVMYIGQVEQDLIGGTQWDRVAIVRYASRDQFAAMTQDPDFNEMAIHKDAGVLDTLVLATTLVDIPQLPPLENPPYPATPDDTVFAFMHVLDYKETAEYQEGDEDADPTRSGRDAVALYSQNAGTVATPLGIQPVAWFDVQATVIGPVGEWEEVRINLFPSHATFDALTSDPTWQNGSHHRSAGLEQTFAIMNQPLINGFNGVVADIG